MEEMINVKIKEESMTKKLLNFFENKSLVTKKDVVAAFPNMKYPSIRLTQLKRENKIVKVKGGYVLKKDLVV